MSTVTVHAGDCLDALRTLPSGSIDAVVTDPPYGLSEHRPKTVEAAISAWTSGDREHIPDGPGGFMSREWDRFVPPPAVWDECLRVLKPGGHLLCFSGSRTVDLMGLSIRLARFEIRDSITWLHSQGFPKGKAQLKPASEPIIVARKRGPLWLNIDACRVPSAEPIASHHMTNNAKTAMGEAWRDEYKPGDAGKFTQTDGRWPANVGLDEYAAEELDQQSGVLKSGYMKPETDRSTRQGDAYGQFSARTKTETYADSGGASRFFPVFKYQAKAPARERPKVDGKGWPTVKPLALMRWLVRLVTPPGGAVLDPFAGTGTTGHAAALEGFRSILIERDELALRLIAERLNRAALGGVA